MRVRQATRPAPPQEGGRAGCRQRASGPMNTTLLPAWACSRPGAEWLLCLGVLAVLAGAGGTPEADATLARAVKVLNAIWGALQVLEPVHLHRRGDEALRSTLPEIYQGHRQGDPAFKPGVVGNLLSRPTAALGVVLLMKSG